MVDFWSDRFKHAVNKEMLGEYALAGLGGVIYTVLPTALGMNGPGAFWLGFGTVMTLGFFAKSKALLCGGIIVAAVHLIYRYGSNYTMRWWQRPIWSLDPNTTTPDDGRIHDYVRSGSMSDYTQLPNGYAALALPPADAPAPMNDFVRAGEPLMDGDDGFMGSTRYGQHGGAFEAPSMFE
jgi:hypothetical protein